MSEEKKIVLEPEAEEKNGQQIYRQSSLERMSETDKLNSTLKLNGMHAWLIIAVAVLLAVGAWCFFRFVLDGFLW